MKKQHIIGAIFARGGSKTVPGKNIRLLDGKPLIAHSIELALKISKLDRVIVSTDSAEIAQVARQFGAQVPFMRPAELSGDLASEWLAWQHAINTLGAGDQGRRPDIMLSIPTTAPLRTQEDVEACLNALIESDADAAVAVTQARRNPYFNMVVNVNGYAKLAAPPSENITRRQDAPDVFDMTTIAYAVRTQFVLRAGSLFEGKVKAIEVPVERSLDIDTELDFQMAEFLMSQNKVRR